MNIKGPLSVEVDRFVTAARSFVHWCESPHADDEPDGLVAEILVRLAELYAAVQHLPDGSYEAGPEAPAEPAGKRDALMANMASLPFHIYWQALEPANLDMDGNIACGHILDDLIDIHSDIRDGLWLYDEGYPQNALWHWRSTYFHWGNHVVGALHALHLYEQTGGRRKID